MLGLIINYYLDKSLVTQKITLWLTCVIMKIKVILVFAIVHAVVQCVSDRLQLFTPSGAAVVRRLDLVVSCQPNFLMMAFSCGLYGMLMILETCHLFYGYFKWHVLPRRRPPAFGRERSLGRRQKGNFWRTSSASLRLLLPPPLPEHHSSPAVSWLVCSYIRGQSCGMPG